MAQPGNPGSNDPNDPNDPANFFPVDPNQQKLDAFFGGDLKG